MNYDSCHLTSITQWIGSSSSTTADNRNACLLEHIWFNSICRQKLWQFSLFFSSWWSVLELLWNVCRSYCIHCHFIDILQNASILSKYVLIQKHINYRSTITTRIILMETQFPVKYHVITYHIYILQTLNSMYLSKMRLTKIKSSITLLFTLLYANCTFQYTLNDWH